MGECVNLTLRGRRCRNRATYTVHHVQGYTSGHCARHYQYWYGGLWQYRTDITGVESVYTRKGSK